MTDLDRDEDWPNELPSHLRGQQLALHNIHSRAAQRRELRRWLREAPGYYYGAIDAAEGIARRLGKPPLVTINQDQLDQKVAEAAIEIYWIGERAKSSRLRNRVNNAKVAWKADPISNPGPDENFGIEPGLDTPSVVSVTGVGSAQGDELAWVAALKLANAYRLAVSEEEKAAKARDQHEDHLERVEKMDAVIDGKSAMRVRGPRGRYVKPVGIQAKAKRAVRSSGQSGRSVSPPSSSSASATTDTLPRRWRDLSLEQKCGLMALSIESEGRGLSITINLAPEVVQAAQAKKKGPVSHLRQRFAQVLKRSFGYMPDFMIVAEQRLHENPHLHGVIDLEDTPENRKVVRHAGEVLSGLPLDGPGRARIVDIQQLENGGFWPGGYTKKSRRSTRKQMKLKRVLAHTEALGQKARAAHAARLE